MTPPGLTEAQMDGRACVRCGRENTGMARAGILDDGTRAWELFRCKPLCDGELPAWMRSTEAQRRWGGDDDEEEAVEQ